MAQVNYMFIDENCYSLEYDKKLNFTRLIYWLLKNSMQQKSRFSSFSGSWFFLPEKPAPRARSVRLQKGQVLSQVYPFEELL
jgi:hypothetical protein